MKPITLMLLLTGVLLFAVSRKAAQPGARRLGSAVGIVAMLAALGIAVFDLFAD
ncbi:hypothetical protein [Erythrobacter insulae]|uniref:hypothetical protein n=1 Tax=Erythrobacter insulae TaxID=2584124 RepID=UPI00163D4D45|nr:hypothetical protein [Erythrobacter insulae]